MKNNKTLKLVQTAIFLALLIVFQYVTKSMGQYVTGSLVNFTLIGSVLAVGLTGGIVVALVSPFLAFVIGIGPAFIQIVPMVALGNLVLVLVYHFMLSKSASSISGKNLASWILTIVVGALAKFAFFYVGLIKLVLPAMLSAGILKDKQVAVLSTSFSFPQLITATIGGVLAMLVMPTVIKAISKKN